MSLLSPWWLLLLPFGYFVIILHTLHPERNKVVVPSVFLWQRVVQELAADARWRRIVANILLLMQLAALALLMLALTQPAFLHQGERHFVVLIDTSVSMSANDLVPNRLEAAKLNLAEFLSKEQPHQITLVEAGPVPRIVHNGPMASVSLLLKEVHPSHGEVDWERVADLVRAVQSDKQIRLVLVTDGAISPEQVQPLIEVAGDGGLSQVAVAGSGENVGIVAFDARQKGVSLNDCEVLVTVVNNTSETIEVPVVVANQDEEVARTSVYLKPGHLGNVIFPYSFSTQDVLEARLEWMGPDVMSADNFAFLTAYPPEPTRVLLIGPGNYHLEQGLRVFPQVRLEKRLLSPTSSDYPLVIFDRMPIPEDFQGTAVYLAGAPSDRERGTETNPQVIGWDKSHALTRYINWSDLAITQSSVLAKKAGAQVLVDSQAAPLIQLVNEEGRRVIEIAFRLDETNWPYKVSFPVFLSHLLQWAHPEGWTYIRSSLSAGAPFRLPQGFRSENGWNVQTPSGSTVHVPLDSDGFFTETLTSGVYRLQGPQGDFPFAINAGSPEESNISPRLLMPTVTEDVSTLDSFAARPFWKWFAVLAFLILLGEEWLYIHKSRRPSILRKSTYSRIPRRQVRRKEA